MQSTFIETDRLILRTWREENLLPFSRLNADSRVMEYFPSTLTFDQTKSFLEMLKTRQEEDGFSFLAAELKSTGEFIGMIGLNRPRYQTPFTPCVEIGWRIAFEHWNNGYATEGATACLAYGFENLNLDEIVSFTASTNLKSQRIMEKIGMQRNPTGDFNHPNVPEGHPLSLHVLYFVKKEQFLNSARPKTSRTISNF